MASKPRYVLPVDVRPMTSHRPCESCGVKSVRYKATLNPPGRGRVTHYLCDRCIESVRLDG